MAGCFSDFEPETISSDVSPRDASTAADAGAASPKDGGARDAGAPDATVSNTDAGGSGGGSDAGSVDPPLPTECNLVGKYAVTERFYMSGLGAKQVVWNWFYVELAQTGNQLSYKKSLSCGASVSGIGIDVEMNDQQAWPAYTMRPAYKDRKGTVEKVADGCMVSIDKDAVVRGGTIEAYRDSTVPLPKKAQMASAGGPGWEDWDEDGQPGVTLHITGFAAGELYAVTRNVTAYAGVVQAGSNLLTMKLDWSQARSTLGYTNILFTADAAPDTSSEQTVQFGKMTDEQATGTDLEICDAVRTLAPTLTPDVSTK